MKYEKNELFEPIMNEENTFIPIFNMHVKVLFEDKHYDLVLGDLKTAYYLLNHLFMIPFLMFLLFAFCTGGCFLGIYKIWRSVVHDS